MNIRPRSFINKGQGLDIYDSRLKRLKDNPRFILINNYKCSCSSCNLLAFDMVTDISREDEVIFLYRDTFLRAISVFMNWCITDDRYIHHEGWLLENLKDELSATSYQRLLDFLHMQQHTNAFRLYVETLEAIGARNDHTLPQVTVLEYYNIDKVDHFVELENNAAFRHITNIEFPRDHTNASDTTIKRSLIRYLINNESLQHLLQRIYRKDLEFFRANNLECVNWQSFGQSQAQSRATPITAVNDACFVRTQTGTACSIFPPSPEHRLPGFQARR